MPILLARNWWAVVLRGVFGILFGIIALVVPGAALAAIVAVFGAYALVDGAFALLAAVRAGRSKDSRWGALALVGIVGVLAGIFTFLVPAATALALVMLVSAWAVLTGVLEIVSAIRLRKAIRGEWLLGLAGLLSIVFGILLFLAPGIGALALTIWIGAYVLVAGIVQVALGFRLRKLAKETSPAQELRAA